MSRSFPHWLPSLLFLLWLGFPLQGWSASDQMPSPSSAESPPTALTDMVGETLSFDISFLWFNRLAKGRFSLVPGQTAGSYRATLDASTLGVAAWLTGDRVQQYVSVMESDPEGRLRTLSFQSRIIKGSGSKRRDRGKLYEFDYAKRVVRLQKMDGGNTAPESNFVMEEGGAPNDFLTAFVNFRAGFFGSLREGARFTIPTFSRKGKAEIVVQILSREERPDLDFFPEQGLLAKIILDPEVLDTSGGAVYMWLDSQGRPARGIVENVLGLGNVRGILKE